MDEFDDLERHLARHLRPERVPGADETWRRIAPLLAGRAERRGWHPALAGAAIVLAALAATLLLAPVPPMGERALGGRPATSVRTADASLALPRGRQEPVAPPTGAVRSATSGARPVPSVGGTPGVVASPQAAATPQAWPCPPAEALALGDCTLDQLAANMPDLDAARRDGRFRPLDLRQTQGAYTLVIYGAYVRVEGGARWIVVVYTASGPGDGGRDGGRAIVMPTSLTDEHGAGIHARAGHAVQTSDHAIAGALYFDASARRDTAPLLPLHLTLTVAQGATGKGEQPVPIAPPFSFAFSVPNPPAGTP